MWVSARLETAPTVVLLTRKGRPAHQPLNRSSKMGHENKKIILGVTGGIAIHKSLDLASQLVKRGVSVHVAMTQNATRLIQPLQFQVISRHPVLLDLFDAGDEWKPRHIDLAEGAALLAIVPATANFIGKMANGIADDALTTVAISTHCPILIAPAMEEQMYHNPYVKANIDKLNSHGVEIIEPVHGDLASGGQGIGRLNTVDVILGRISRLLSGRQDLQKKKVVVTAGPTREHIDPTRFISNRSSGKMGYAIADAAQRRGAEVTLISGPTTLSPPTGVELCSVETADGMRDAVLRAFDNADVAVMAAAVADYRPKTFSPDKLKKTTDELTLLLDRNPDIAEMLGQRKQKQILVCFAAETGNLLENARSKLIKKNCDLMVANDILAEGAGFGEDTNIVTLLDGSDNQEQLPLLPKREVANVILDRVVAMLGQREKQSPVLSG